MKINFYPYISEVRTIQQFEYEYEIFSTEYRLLIFRFTTHPNAKFKVRSQTNNRSTY